MATKNIVTYTEKIAIQGFLGYLHDHYSKLINKNDALLIAAVAAWYRQESGSLAHVVGNNPFNIRDSPLASGVRYLPYNGHFAVFKSMAQGFMAAAYLLMHGGWGTGAKDADAYGYRLALNALKQGGNDGAWNFLAALAMSKWDSGHYGATDWASAWDQKKNHLLRNYVSITGVQMTDPNPKRTKAKPVPALPRDHQYPGVVKSYLDPWAAGKSYQRRHKRGTVQA